MEFKEFLQVLPLKRKGTFRHIVYKSVDKKTGYTKQTETAIRFCSYYNKKSVIEKGITKDSTKANPNVKMIIKDILEYNNNTENYLIHCIPTKAKRYCKYYDNNGNEITKDQYNAIVTKKSYSGDTEIFKISLKNLISLA